ncbi:MAG: hypothetical protein QM428_08230, partial [Verrucomicrobiota bacterium]|nr:hypothetical protein [Verrucomicrobiota bacterium]
LKYYAGCTIYAMITNIEQPPEYVTVDGEVLAMVKESIKRQTGWHYDSDKKRLYLGLPNSNGTVKLQIK